MLPCSNDASKSNLAMVFCFTSAVLYRRCRRRAASDRQQMPGSRELLHVSGDVMAEKEEVIEDVHSNSRHSLLAAAS